MAAIGRGIGRGLMIPMLAAAVAIAGIGGVYTLRQVQQTPIVQVQPQQGQGGLEQKVEDNNQSQAPVPTQPAAVKPAKPTMPDLEEYITDFS